MTQKTLLDKVWDDHSVRVLSDGRTQLLIGTHLIHEVTSPQAFGMLRATGLSVMYPHRTFATIDHIVPTDQVSEPFTDPLADNMVKELRKNCQEYGITFFDITSGKQGIVHIIGPEQGITQPGMTIACGDSHTSTHGAFGAIAFGIGSSQVRDILATQTIALRKPKIRRIQIDGKLSPGVYAKDVILHIIRKLGVNGGVGFAYEYAGSLIKHLSQEERMTVCNMSIEGGARVGYINPDITTFEYLQGRPYAPKGEKWNLSVRRWEKIISDPDADYDDYVFFRSEDISPTVTWGINPSQSVFIHESIPTIEETSLHDRPLLHEALHHMQLNEGMPIAGIKIDVAFLGSCTNGRLSDLKEVAHYIKGYRVADHVKAIVVPGSQIVANLAEEMGLADIFRQAGFEWRSAGCSMCLGMNPDKLIGNQLCASSSNRNFKGRQGSPTGRTMLMSPLMVAAAAITGRISDARQVFGIQSSL